MTDPIKTVEGDAKTVLTDVQAEIAKLHADETKASGWIALHHVVIYVFLAFVVGSLSGYFLHVK